MLVVTLFAPRPAAAGKMVGYWNGPSGDLATIDQVNPQWDIIVAAFATYPDPSMSTDLKRGTLKYSPNDPNWDAHIATLHARGKRVLLAIGGAGQFMSMPDGTTRDNALTSLVSLINQYHFDGFDIDLEESSILVDANDRSFINPSTPSIVNWIYVIRNARSQTRGMLTFAPQTTDVAINDYGGDTKGTASGHEHERGRYLPLIYATRTVLSYVAIQCYNSGGQYTVPVGSPPIDPKDVYGFATGEAENLMRGFYNDGAKETFPPLPPSKVVIGLRAERAAEYTPDQAIGIEKYITTGVLPATAPSTTRKLMGKPGYPDFGGFMLWSIGIDHTAQKVGTIADQYATTVGPFVHYAETLPKVGIVTGTMFTPGLHFGPVRGVVTGGPLERKAFAFGIANQGGNVGKLAVYKATWIGTTTTDGVGTITTAGLVLDPGPGYGAVKDAYAYTDTVNDLPRLVVICALTTGELFAFSTIGDDVWWSSQLVSGGHYLNSPRVMVWPAGTSNNLIFGTTKDAGLWDVHYEIVPKHMPAGQTNVVWCVDQGGPNYTDAGDLGLPVSSPTGYFNPTTGMGLAAFDVGPVLTSPGMVGVQDGASGYFTMSEEGRYSWVGDWFGGSNAYYQRKSDGHLISTWWDFSIGNTYDITTNGVGTAQPLRGWAPNAAKSFNTVPLSVIPLYTNEDGSPMVFVYGTVNTLTSTFYSDAYYYQYQYYWEGVHIPPSGEAVWNPIPMTDPTFINGHQQIYIFSTPKTSVLPPDHYDVEWYDGHWKWGSVTGL
jgi:chitinase